MQVMTRGRKGVNQYCSSDACRCTREHIKVQIMDKWRLVCTYCHKILILKKKPQ